MKYHLTDDGPKRCVAKTAASCRASFQGESAPHFSGEGAARRAFEEAHSPLPSKHQHPSSPMVLTEATQQVVGRLREAGVTPYLVGGSVRDHLMGVANKDVDIEVYGEAPQGGSLSLKDLQGAFPRKEGFRVDEAGASFAVLKVSYRGEDFDVSLPRTERSTGEGHREYEVLHDSTLSFEEASSRRDFTINSMAYDPATGEILDPHGGVEDLRKGVLRHVGPAFSDDPLRCLRAMNFAGRFNLRLAPETEALCRDLAPSYPTLASERVEEEFNKVFSKGVACERSFEVLHATGWAAQMPAFAQASRDELQRYGRLLNEVPRGLPRKGTLVLLMEKDGHGSPLEVLERSSRGRTAVGALLRLEEATRSSSWGSMVAAHRAMKKAEPSWSNETLATCLRQGGGNAAPLRDLPEVPVAPLVTGKALQARGFAAGPEMGAIIKRAQRLQDEGRASTFEDLLTLALRES